MTLEEVEVLVKNAESKLSNIKDIINDYKICNGQQSKTILLAAASKLAMEFKPTQDR